MLLVRAEQVGPGTRADSGRSCVLDRRLHVSADLLHPVRDRRREAPPLVLGPHDVRDREGRDQRCARLGHQHGGLLVEPAPVLEARDPGLESVADAARVVGVRRHVGVAGLGLEDRGTKLLDRELRVLELVGERDHPTADHHLELGRATSERLARREPHLVRSVGERDPFDEAGDRERAPAIGERRHESRVPAVLCERGPRREDPRTRDQPLVDRLDDPAVEPAHVATRGEPGEEGVATDSEDAGGDLGRGQRAGVPVVLELERDAEMGVGVDESGQEREPLEVDDLGIPRCAATVIDRADPSVLDDDGDPGDGVGAGAVEQRGTAQREDAHGRGSTRGNSAQRIGAPGAISGSRSSRNVPGCGS